MHCIALSTGMRGISPFLDRLTRISFQPRITNGRKVITTVHEVNAGVYEGPAGLLVSNEKARA
jgi:hypothetical protein